MKDLYTERLNLRKLDIEDASLFYKNILTDKEHLHFLNWPYCSSEEEAKNFIDGLIWKSENLNQYFWVIEEKESKKFIGCILVCEYIKEKRMAEVEYILVREECGKGYMSEALKGVIHYLFNQCNIFRIEAVCNVENILSSKVMENAGMKFEGILRGRAFYLNEEGNPGDLKMYSIILTDVK